MNRFQRTLLVTSPLVSGFIIYFSCRPKSLLYYQWIPFRELIGLDHLHNYAAEECSKSFGGSPVANTIIFSIPAAMFAFSLAFYLKTRYLHKAFIKLKLIHKFTASFALILIIAYIPEYLQQIGVLPGHFDPLDVLTAGLATALALYVGK
jgi:hypothetical protein